MIDLEHYRCFYAEELQIASNLTTPGLVSAFAVVPRELFLPPGPWVVRSESDVQAPLRTTPGDDPRFVYHNVAVGIDPGRMLFNGAPGFVSNIIDRLALAPGTRVLHIGAGTGYYTAVAATTVGPAGRVLGIEVDAELAATASANLLRAGLEPPRAEVRHGDGRGPFDEAFDAVLINTGLTHPERSWLEALAPGGRMVVPLTATLSMPRGALHPAGAAMANISKGLMVHVTKTEDPDRFEARVVTFVAIYSAVGVRDDAVNAALGQALVKMPFPPLTHLRFDVHDPAATCWCHTPRGCWSMA